MSTPTIEQIEHLEPIDCNRDGKFKGTVPDPRIAAYYGSDPAAFVAQCCVRPRDDERLRIFADWCEEAFITRGGTNHDYGVARFRMWVEQTNWKAEGRIVKAHEAAAILRSLFAPPWLCGAGACGGELVPSHLFAIPIMRCPVCAAEYRAYDLWKMEKQSRCITPILTPPEFDARWRTVDVLMVALGVRGGECPDCEGTGCKGQAPDVVCRCKRCKSTGKLPPDFSRMPILADALMDAGCDGKAMIWHARENGQYVVSDWVLSLILGEV